jgi:hypothetical protein
MVADDFPDSVPQSLPGTMVLRRIAKEFGPDGSTPAYAASDAAPRAIPTGRVLVRFDEGIRFEDRADAMTQAGYPPDKPLDYAPHAGWVRAESGRTADALRNLDRLAAMPDVRHVEPEMLYTRNYR